MSSAVISCRGVCVSGSRNWCLKRVDLAGLRSDAEILRAWVGSMRDCAFCTRLVKLENIAHGSAGSARGDVVLKSSAAVPFGHPAAMQPC